jgi:hypothetical protein
LCAAAVLGTRISFAGLRAMIAIVPESIPALYGVGGWPSVLFAAGAALVAALCFGLAPICVAFD